MSDSATREWLTMETVPKDRFVLLHFDQPRWAGNMEVGRWFGDDEDYACFWSSGGPNGGLELGGMDTFDAWSELPPDPTPPTAANSLPEEIRRVLNGEGSE